MKRLFFSILFVLNILNIANAGTVSRYFNYQTNSEVNSTNLNGNFDNIVTVLNGDVDNTNVNTTDGYRLYEVLGVLPVAGTLGRTVFYTVDKTLNFDTGSQWYSAITLLRPPVQGDVVYYDGTNWVVLAAGTSGQALRTQGASANPAWANEANSVLTTQGDILYRDGSGLQRLGAGTSDYFLKTQGAGANPAWATVDAVTLDGYDSSTTAGASKIYVSGGDNYLPDATVDTTALKTATGEVSFTVVQDEISQFYLAYGTNSNASYWPTSYVSIIGYYGSTSGTLAYVTLPGGTYGFYPQVKYTAGTTCLAQQRYVTASGEDIWIFLLIDKITKDIIAAYQAPDHPAYGNGGDFDKLSHPFGSYNETKCEIILLDKETCLAIKQESEQTGKSILTLVNEEYKPNMLKEEVYQPLHSGKFIDKKPELVQSIPAYIKVRKLSKLTDTDKQQREIIKQRAIQKTEQDKIKKEQDRISAENKLKAIGLTEKEIKALK